MAYPEEPSDPLLRKWVKDPENPILRPPPGIGLTDFRDPTTAWKDTGGDWLMAIGSKVDKTGLALLYKSADLRHWELQENALHAVLGTGMWECVDFYPVPVQGRRGLETHMTAAPAVKYVLKASLDDDNDRHDYYALGSYNTTSRMFRADDPARDTGIGLRYDYGKLFASKTFFDPVQQRRILWGWANESDSEAAAAAKGWAGVQVRRTQLIRSGIHFSLSDVRFSCYNGYRRNVWTSEYSHQCEPGIMPGDPSLSLVR
jgi:beta-fructofuranosidase